MDENEVLIPQELLHEVHGAIVSAELDVESILRGLHPTINASLPSASTSSERLLNALSSLNRMELESGLCPLQAVLRTAQILAGPRKEAAVFRRALSFLDGMQRAQSRQIGIRTGATAERAAPSVRLSSAITLTIIASGISVLSTWLLLHDRKLNEQFAPPSTTCTPTPSVIASSPTPPAVSTSAPNPRHFATNVNLTGTWEVQLFKMKCKLESSPSKEVANLLHGPGTKTVEGEGSISRDPDNPIMYSFKGDFIDSQVVRYYLEPKTPRDFDYVSGMFRLDPTGTKAEGISVLIGALTPDPSGPPVPWKVLLKKLPKK